MITRVTGVRTSPLLLAALACAAARPAAAATWGAPVFHHLTTSDGLSHSDARTFHQDGRGFLWIGTADGLNRYDGYRFRVFRHDPADPGSMGPGAITAIAEDGTGQLWIGLLAGGVSRFDPRSETFRRYRHDPADPRSLGADAVTALAFDPSGRLWVGTRGGGLGRLDPVTGQVTRFAHDPGDRRSLPSDDVTVLRRDRSGVLWIGTRGGGLSRYAGDAAGGPFESYPRGARDGGSPAGDDVSAIVEGADGTLWIGTRDGSLDGFDATRARFTRHIVGRGAGAPAGRDHVQALVEDRTGKLWIATSAGGVKRLDRSTGRLEALSHVNVVSLFMDRGGLLWIASAGGGVDVVELAGGDPAPPPVVLTSFGLSHRPVAPGPGSVLRQAIGHTTSVELPHDALILNLEFAALCFRDPQRNRFRYRLSGFDGEWNPLENGAHSATYTNLAPGRYVFQVQGATAQGVWNEEGATLAIRIRPPWWGTWWFQGLATLAAAGLLLAAHRYRTRSVEARSVRLEREVRERELAQRALIRSERQLRLLADALPVMIAYLDADGRVGFSNLASESWFGRPRSELEGRLVQEVLRPEVYAQVREHVEMAQGGERVEFDVVLGAPGDVRRRISSTLVPHTEGHGRVLGVYAFAQDITERVRIQEELHRQQDQLAHASRVSTLGEMATALAHELNQPLTAVLSNAHATLRMHAAPVGRPMADDVEETLRDIAQDAARAGEIIRRLRELIRKGRSKKGPLDLGQAIRGVEALIRATALENDVAFGLDLAADLPLCDGDAIQIQQVVLNLVRNGIEAMRSLPKPERRMVVRTLHEKEAVTVSVEDAGPPVADEVLDQFFMPFYTTKENGLGMGLSISRSIIQAHGGSIVARRGVPRGVVVRFTLPAGARSSEAGGSRISA
jgi:PAS domain S-box-containing protein